MTSIDSARADSMNAQVFTTMRSAISGPAAQLEASVLDVADELVAVDHILRTPERFDPVRRHRHPPRLHPSRTAAVHLNPFGGNLAEPATASIRSERRFDGEDLARPGARCVDDHEPRTHATRDAPARRTTSPRRRPRRRGADNGGRGTWE